MSHIVDIRKKIVGGEIDINDQSLFFSILLKGFLSDLNNKIKISNKEVLTYILNTGDDILYLENKGQNQSIEPLEVSNEAYIYTQIPRCIVNPKGVNINTDQLTSPYTRGNCQLDIDGEVMLMTAEFRRMPITMSVDLTYYLDSYKDTLQCIQQLISKLAFIRSYNISYLGQQVMCSYKLPDAIEDEKQINIEGDTKDSKLRKISLSLEIVSNIPIYDNRTAIEASLLIANPKLQLQVK